MNSRFVAGPLHEASDPIFALNARAMAQRAAGQSVVNATLGAILRDDGSLAVLPSAARAMQAVAGPDWAPYAPITGENAFSTAVLDDVFGAQPGLRERARAVATPGGAGALKLAVTTFLEAGQALLTTSHHWSPYATICEEHARRVVSFEMFTESSRGSVINIEALERSLGELAASQGRLLVLVNDPCQNPTGYSMTSDEWADVAAALGKWARRVPTTILLDAAYAAYSASGLARPLRALAALSDEALVLVAWSASKSFTLYGARVGALVVAAGDEAEGVRIQSALGHACRGTWASCSRGGMLAVTQLLQNEALRQSVHRERSELIGLLAERLDAFERNAQGLRFPRTDEGFFVTVFCADAPRVADELQLKGVFVVPGRDSLRIALCAVPLVDIPRLAECLSQHVR